MDNTLISRAVVQSEFRKAADLVERIGGGAGPGGVKAVAPTGTEHDHDHGSRGREPGQHSRREADRRSRPTAPHATYTSPGRPIAVISNVMIEYQPPPPPKPARSGAPGRSGRPGE